MNKLPQEFKEKWVASLRSGEYKQGKQTLFRNGKYCCLGVAAHIAGIKIPINAQVISSEAGVKNIRKIPAVLRGDSFENDVVYTLTKMNDRDGKSFSKIADYIEQNL